MRATIRRKVSMAAKSLSFEQANPSTDESHAGVVARLAEVVARADAIFVREQNGTIGQHGAVARRREVRRTLSTRLRHLVNVGKVAAKANPDMIGEFVAPNFSGPNRNFVGAARALVAQAKEHEAALIEAGLGSGTLTEITDRISAFEVASGETDVGRREHVEAIASFAGLARTGTDLVRILDGLNLARFEKEPELLAAWKSARNVYGPFARKAGDPEPEIGLLQSGPM